TKSQVLSGAKYPALSGAKSPASSATAGVAHPDADNAKQFRFAEVVVAGGGPAGLSAALAAAARGAKVLLCDANAQLGGHLRYSRDPGPLAELRAAVAAQANIAVLGECTRLGGYE